MKQIILKETFNPSVLATKESRIEEWKEWKAYLTKELDKKGYKEIEIKEDISKLLDEIKYEV